MKRPSFQFYPGDWLNDAALRMCSVGARGLWIDMICLMHQGSEYGYLKVNHIPILPPNLARIVGATIIEVEGWLEELELVGVFMRDEHGCIFSKRMVRDEEVRAARAAGGVFGGNPALLCGAKKAESKAKPKEGKVNLPTNLLPTPSSSTSISSLRGVRSNAARDGFEVFYKAYPRKVGKKKALDAYKAGKVDAALPTILEDIGRRSTNGEWSADQIKYIPYPATYLNGRRWEDEADVRGGVQPSGGGVMSGAI